MTLTGTARQSPLIASLCFLTAILEGFDLQVAGIAAPAIKAEFGLDSQSLGLFFSASTLGLLFGAILGGRLSDKLGRTQVLAWSVAGFGAGSLLTAMAVGPMSLIAARFVTGLGLGGALPNLLALTSENAQPGRERRAVALLYCGVPIGGAGVSLLGAAFGHEWRSLFVIGGALPLILGFAIHRVGSALPRSLGNQAQVRNSMMALFGSGRLISSLLIWISFFATLIILYLVLNWLPTLLTAAGLDGRTAFLAQMAFNLGGLVLCGLTASLLDLQKGWLVAFGAFCAIPVLLWLSDTIDGSFKAVALAFSLGGAVLVTQSYLYALAPRLYPAPDCGIGVGAAVAAGRLGSIAGPLLGAALLSSGGSVSNVLQAIIPVAVIAGIAAITLSLRHQHV